MNKNYHNIVIVIILILLNCTPLYAKKIIMPWKGKYDLDIRNNLLVFSVANWDGVEFPLPSEKADIYLVDLRNIVTNSFFSDINLCSLSFRSNTEKPELWLTRPSKMPLSLETILIKTELVGNKIETIKKYTSPISIGLNWNPSGTIVAGSVPPLTLARNKNMNPLDEAIGMFDVNKEINHYYYGSPVFGAVICWLNNESFYSINIAGTEIQKFKINKDDIQLSSTVVTKNNKIQLLGIYANKPLYSCNDGIFASGNNIYTSKLKKKSFSYSYPYLSFLEEQDLVILNCADSSVVRKKAGEKITILGTDSQRKYSYFTDLEVIYRVSFDENEEIDIIYELN